MARNNLTPQDEVNKKIISKNINLLLLKHNKNQTDLCDFTGIPKSTINGYVKGTSLPKAGNLQKIADFFNVGKSCIDPRFSSNQILNNGDFVKIPIISNIYCSNSITDIENIIDYNIRTSKKLPTGNLFYLYAKDDSMTPLINNDDLVLIKEQSDAENDDIVAIILDNSNEITLNRIKKKGNIIFLMSENSNYDPIIIDENSDTKIIGKAIEVTSKL